MSGAAGEPDGPPRDAPREAMWPSDGSDELVHPVLSRRQLRKWKQMNEQYVDDVHIRSFYQSHTLLMLFGLVCVLIYYAMVDDVAGDDATRTRVVRGLSAGTFAFIIFSIVALPNGPFVRPHPAIWRVVLGMSVLYWLVLVFCLFQTRTAVRDSIEWISAEILHYNAPEDDPEYGMSCDFTPSNLWSRVDVFTLAHSLGWIGKALMLRSSWLCWSISIAWEITEMIFAEMLPNFNECWWDQILYDVIVCNGGGIFFGIMMCKYLECREYRWESITDVPTLRGKAKRVALQFTPQRWTKVAWEPFSSRKRTLASITIILCILLTELSTFFLKHVLQLPTKHWINVLRLVLWFLFGLPTLRQLYIYLTDGEVKRLGTQMWVALAVMITELLLCVKFGREMFDPVTSVRVIATWLLITLGSITLGMLWAEHVRISRSREPPASQHPDYISEATTRHPSRTYSRSVSPVRAHSEASTVRTVGLADHAKKVD